MLSLRQPFRANDHVLIDDLEGRVIRLTSRATILMTLDGNHLRIPNGQVFKAVILNYTRNPQRRFEFELGIDADDDPDAARRLGRETLAGLPFVLDQPGPEARTEAVGDSNIVIRFLGWIDQREADWFKARSRAIATVKTALEDAGFGLPEPIYRLRFDPRSEPLPFANMPRRQRRPCEESRRHKRGTGRRGARGHRAERRSHGNGRSRTRRRRRCRSRPAGPASARSSDVIPSRQAGRRKAVSPSRVRSLPQPRARPLPHRPTARREPTFRVPGLCSA